MILFYLKIFMWVFLSWSFLIVFSSSCSSCSCSSWSPQHLIQQNASKQIFKQRTDRFWEYEEQSNSWVEVNLPFDLVSCINDNCTKIGTIGQKTRINEELSSSVTRSDVPENEEKLKSKSEKNKKVVNKSVDMVLRVRKRVSLTKMSETSVWITGESGSIYERFWNGLQWVLAPHDLPETAGRAVSVIIVNQTILALSESGNLYQLKLSESSQPVWVEITPMFEPNIKETEESSIVLIKSALVSYDGQRVYFSTMNRSLLELSEVEPLRWINHRRPPGGDVAAIADASTMKQDVVFIVSAVQLDIFTNTIETQSHHGRNIYGLKEQHHKKLH